MSKAATTPTILITDASSGIGAAVAELYSRRGCQLFLLARREERLQEMKAHFERRDGSRVGVFVVDVRERSTVEAWGAAHADVLQRVDVLVNSAGLARGFAKLHEGDVDDWDEMIDANVKGLLYITREVLPHMVARGSGHVVNVGSVAGRWVYPQGAVYCASKHAERAISEGLRLDLSGTGVRVTTVDPGLVETEFSLVRFHGDAQKAALPYRGMTPLAAGDVADVIAWTVDRPPHVNISEVVVYPTDQASPTLVHRRSE